MLHLVVYDFETFSTKSVIERALYVEYQPTYVNGGTFSVTAQKTDNNSKSIKKGDFIWIEGNIVGKINQIQVSETSETVIFKGTLCDDVLSSRYIFEELEYTDSAVNTVISDLFSNITPISNLSLSISTQTLKRPDITVGPGNFLDILKYICEQFKVGYKIVKSPTTSGLQLVLTIYEGQNKSDSVVMSRKYESLTNFELTDVATNEINFVRVLGENNTIVDVTSLDYTVQNRREYFLDCSGVEQGEMTLQEYQALLTSKGQNVIDSHKGQTTYKGDSTGLTFVFGQDYTLGDIVTVSGLGENSNQQVTSVLKQIDKTGEYLKVFFGQLQTTLTSQVHSTMKQVEKISEKADSQPSSGGDCVGKFIDQNHTSIAFNDLTNNSSQGKYDIIAGKNNVLTGTMVSSGETCDDNFVSGINNKSYRTINSVITGRGNDFTQSDTSGLRGTPTVKNSFVAGRLNKGALWNSVCVGLDNDVTLNNCVLAGENIITRYPEGDISGASQAVNCGIFGCYHDVTGPNAIYCGTQGYGRKTNEASHEDWVIIVGGGTIAGGSENIFTVESRYGNVKAKGTITPGGADYAETYEWLDGNPDDEDRRGLFVTLEGKFIKFANSNDDYILGVISATPSILGDTYDLYWKGKYKTDVFGNFILDEDKHPIISEEFDRDKPYYSQSSRKEKSPVGTHGKLVVIDDGTCVVNKYCKPSIHGIGTYSDNPCHYRVLERLDNNHIKIVLK